MAAAGRAVTQQGCGRHGPAPQDHGWLLGKMKSIENLLSSFATVKVKPVKQLANVTKLLRCILRKNM